MITWKIIGVLLFYVATAFQQGHGIRGEYQYIRVAYQQQVHNLCVPTSASMVLHFYGDTISPATLKAISTPKGSTFEGTYLADLVAGVKTLGYNWEVKTFSPDDSGFLAGFAEIMSALDAGHPILLSTSSPPIGNTMVMVGYDIYRREIFLIDPNREAPGKRTISFDTFKTIWHEDIAKARAFVLTRPK
jgi:hypothetical protein